MLGAEDSVASAKDDAWVAGDAYEAFMGRWSRMLARAFLDWLSPPRGVHWLDVGCGTGALTAAICEQCEPASVLACDPSAAFVAHAQRHADARASFVVAGVDALPAREGPFDAIVSGLVLNFLADPSAAIASFRERARTPGTIAAYVWDYADGMELLRIFWDEAHASGEHDERTRFPLCRPDALRELFRGAGLSQVQVEAITIPTTFASFDDYWAPLLRGTGPAPSYVAALDAGARDALRQRLERRLRPYDDGSIRLQARAWAVRGAT
jgi:SAM-dependent methyltransferase